MPTSVQVDKLVRRVKHPRRSARTARRASRLLLGLSQPAVIVLGNQKSGTSAVAALLAKRAGLRATIDIRDLWNEQFVKLRHDEKSFRVFAAFHPTEFSAGVVKEPNLTFLYPQLRRVFPDSKVLYVVRDPRANVRSILSRLALPGDAHDLSRADLDSVPWTWRPVLEPSVLGFPPGTHVETLARRWNTAVDAYLDHAHDMLLVTYEDFLRDKVATIDALARDLALPAHGTIHDSVDRQFQPRGSDTPFEQFFGRPNLARLSEICNEYASRLGYDLAG